MPDEFFYDVFLSQSAYDKAVERPLAERSRADEVRTLFDEWVLRPGDSVSAKVEEEQERTRVLALCMSANAFGLDWTHLESGTSHFRDLLNKKRCFPSLRFDNALIKGSDWFRKEDGERQQPSGARQIAKSNPQGKRGDVHQSGVPPKSNASFVWAQHFIHHLAPHGIAGFVIANGSTCSNQSGESGLRRGSN